MNGVVLASTALYGPIRADLTIVERVFDDELAGDLPFASELCETIRQYRGKMLRPAMLLLSGRAAGKVSSTHHTLAAVVELVHLATLVHDDVLDEADERRCQPTIGSICGNTAAVLVGDFLISHAFRLCTGLPTRHAARSIGATTNTVCEGELLQNYRRGDADLSESAYLDIVRRKTGALTATACELGAYYADANDTVVDAMRNYGESAGIAFQLIDDVLDIVGDQQLVGKTLGRDLTLGKLTLPTIHALANGKGGASASIRAALDGQGACDRRHLREWLDETGSIDYCVSVATEYSVQACRHLEILPPSDAKASLAAIAEFLVERSI